MRKNLIISLVSLVAGFVGAVEFIEFAMKKDTKFRNGIRDYADRCENQSDVKTNENVYTKYQYIVPIIDKDFEGGVLHLGPVDTNH